MKMSLRQYSDVLATYLRSQRLRVGVLAVVLLGSVGVQLVIPQVLRTFIDATQAGRSPDLLIRVALIFLGVAIVKYALNLGTTYASELVAWTATNAMRGDLASHCLRLEMSFHTTHTPGELIERIDGDVSKLSTFFTQLVIRSLASLLMLVGVLVLLSFEDWRVGLAFTLFAAVTLFILSRMRDIATPHLQAERQASAELFGFLEERLAGTEDIRANGGYGYTLRRLFELIRTVWRADLTASLKIATLRTTIIFFFSISSILALVFGAYLFWAGAMTIGTVYLIFAYVQMLGDPIQRLALEAQNFQQASASLLRISELYNTRSAIQDGTRARLPERALAVTFHDVSFGYDKQAVGHISHVVDTGNDATDDTNHATSHVVLRDISFQLRPGEVLGLLGRTGSGKTTITRLLLRLYDPTNGAVLLNDTDIRDVPLADLHRSIGVVTQEVQLFHATVRDNLTFFDPDIGDIKILQVIENLGLMEWYRKLGAGLDTVLESGGGGLSAGEAQLLAFTRVFLKDPGVIILDEASSRLDPATERLIERAVDRLLAGRTAIVIAHRLATVQRADTIMILQDGQIAEYGPRQILASTRSSHFAQLLRVGTEVALTLEGEEVV